jgi:hypothetical protein
MLYEPGETVELIADLIPAKVEPYPAELPHTQVGVPQTALMFRVIITTRGLVVAWQAGGRVQRVDIPVPGDRVTATYRGGDVGPYRVSRVGGCPCGARLARDWPRDQIFPGTVWTQVDTLAQARVDAAKDSRYGLPSVRDTRTRYTRTSG